VRLLVLISLVKAPGAFLVFEHIPGPSANPGGWHQSEVLLVLPTDQ
jgi:hypothetical protein